MGELPTGTITMLFSDIEGSTLLMHDLGDRYGDALSAQRAVAAEYVLMPVGDETEEPAAEPSLPHLSSRERELVTLVAKGRTKSQIVGHLSISIPAVRSSLDRILARTRSQRRADLTRLALQADLV